MSTVRPTMSQRRPVPVWVQGLVTGLAAALVPVAAVALFSSTHGHVSAGTQVLVYSAVVALALAVGAYIPVPTNVSTTPAVGRDSESSQALPAPTRLRVIPGEGTTSVGRTARLGS